MFDKARPHIQDISPADDDIGILSCLQRAGAVIYPQYPGAV